MFNQNLLLYVTILIIFIFLIYLFLGFKSLNKDKQLPTHSYPPSISTSSSGGLTQADVITLIDSRIPNSSSSNGGAVTIITESSEDGFRNFSSSELGYEIDISGNSLSVHSDLNINNNLNIEIWEGMIMPFYFMDLNYYVEITDQRYINKINEMRSKHWYFCDGNLVTKNGVTRRTPNLKGRMLLGSGAVNATAQSDNDAAITGADAEERRINAENWNNSAHNDYGIRSYHDNIDFKQGYYGGSDKHKLDRDTEMPSHNHGYSGAHYGHNLIKDTRHITLGQENGWDNTVTSADTGAWEREFVINMKNNYDHEDNTYNTNINNYHTSNYYQNATKEMGNHTHLTIGGNERHNNMPPFMVANYFIYWPEPWIEYS